MDSHFPWMIFSILAWLVCVRGEVFTALVEMENLVHREREMVAALKDYVKQEETRLETIRQFTRKLDKIHERIPQGKVENYLGHPSNAYLLIKRFVNEWPAVEDMARMPSYDDLIATIDKHRDWFPDVDDLYGAITAIFRVQEIFQVKSLQLSNDLVPSQTRGYPMDADDAFIIGKRAYEQNKYHTAKTWLDASLAIWDEGRREGYENKAEILDYLSFVEYKLGNLRRAYNMTLEILRHEPTHERAQKNLKYYADELKKSGQLRNGKVLADNKEEEENKDVDSEEEVDWKGSGAYKRYSRLCRSDPGALHNHTLREQRQLTCWFHKYPWLHIRGIGVERLHVTPEVLYFRNVLTDEEIEKIKTLGRPKLNRAVIQHPVTGNLEVADYRISKSGWLKDDEDPIITRISRRTGHLTGLEMNTAEELQVNTYGMGGHYEPHYDHAQDHEDKFSDLGCGNRIATVLYYDDEEKFPRLGTGNRIATILYYMSDVELGGGTAFINVGALVEPRKGDGVFWYNLFRNGNGNDDTRHAACPVLVGTKWVANKWIHEKGQEFRHKCSLNYWE